MLSARRNQELKEATSNIHVQWNLLKWTLQIADTSVQRTSILGFAPADPPI